MSKFLTVKEVAQMLNVSTRTVRRLCESEDLTHYKIGSVIKITEEDLQNYLIKNKKGDFKNE